MNQNEYIVIKQYLGTTLLKYLLNYAQDISWETSFSELILTGKQSQVMKMIYDLIVQSRLRFIQQGGFGDGFSHCIYDYHVNNENVFNYCRKLCGGAFPNLSNISEDKLLSFMLKLAIMEYPNFLIKSSHKGLPSFANHRILKDISQYEEFIALMKDDVLDNLTNKKNGFDYCFSFETNNNLKFYNQISNACEIIISRSFENCCKKMKYSIDDFLNEIKISVSNLRDLAQGKEVMFSAFIGVQGITFKGVDTIELSDCTFRAIDSLANPGQHLVFSILNEEQDRYISGAIIEIKFPMKAILHERKNQRQTFSEDLPKHINNCLENLKFSVCFSLRENYGFTTSFQENGFPLVPPGNCHFDNNYSRKNVKIAQSHIQDIEDWYKKLSTINKTSIEIPLKRLNYAIHVRSDPEDAIIDAITAWEALFSGTPETTFKVTASIAKFLKTETEREDFFKRLKDLYTLRSKIVHGDKLLKKEADIIRAEVIKIGLDCLKKILDKTGLLTMTPSKRVESILMMT